MVLFHLFFLAQCISGKPRMIFIKQKRKIQTKFIEHQDFVSDERVIGRKQHYHVVTLIKIYCKTIHAH